MHVPSSLSTSVLQRLIKDNILASETIAIVLPTIALIPCTIYAAYIRSDPTIVYTRCVRNGVLPYLHEIKIGDSFIIYEPFSTTTNLAYIMSGIGIYLYYIPNRAFVHMQMYIVGSFLSSSAQARSRCTRAVRASAGGSTRLTSLASTPSSPASPARRCSVSTIHWFQNRSSRPLATSFHRSSTRRPSSISASPSSCGDKSIKRYFW